MGEKYKGTEPPSIYIFPRSKDTLFERYISKKVPTPEIYYQDYLGTYEDSTTNELPKIVNKRTEKETTMKEIENRIYVDLWNNKSYDKSNGQCIFEITKKITIGFLKREKNNIYKSYKFLEPPPLFQCPTGETKLVVTVDPKNINEEVYIGYGDPDDNTKKSKNSPKKCIYIPINTMSFDYLVECTLYVSCNQNNINEKREIEIIAHLIHTEKGIDEEIGNKSRLKMSLYRYLPEKIDENDPFVSLMEKDKDKDIFIMPRLCQNNDQAVQIKQLQIYSNQVLARHNGIKDDPAYGSFNFVKEDGIYTDQLGINYGMSIDVFRDTVKKRGILGSEIEDKSWIVTVFEYKFDTFGQEAKLVKFLSSNYALDEKTIKKLVVDRNFIYGAANVDQSKIENIQGLKNLYERVVNVFRQRMVEEANRYVNFGNGNPNRRWLSKPKINPNYKRGNFTITPDMSKNIYDKNDNLVTITINSQSYTQLPVNAIIEFHSGKDDNDDITGINKCRVKEITHNGVPVTAPDNSGWYIELSYKDRQTCNDRCDENFCDYIGRDIDIKPENMSDNDRIAIRGYNNYGVPYYISDWEKKNKYGGKLKLSAFNVLESNVENWYLYPMGAKPNSPDKRYDETKGVGLDCSGLIINCLLDIRYNGNNNNYNDRDRFFKVIKEEKEEEKYEVDYRDYGESVPSISSKRVRIIPYTLIYNDNTLIQSADLLYIPTGENKHIALCAIELNEYVNKNQITTNDPERGNFRIIHNYGGDKISYINKNAPQSGLEKYSGGFFKKTLSGPFRHVGVGFGINDTQANAGRVYLWY